MVHSCRFTIPGSSRCVKFLPFLYMSLMKRRTFYTLGRSTYGLFGMIYIYIFICMVYSWIFMVYPWYIYLKFYGNLLVIS